MKQEQQRIAIAEACPFIFVGSDGDFYWDCPIGGTKAFDHRDLNAMAEVELWLNEPHNDAKGLAAKYCEELEELFERDCACWIEHLGATAAQRAEAFLKTIGKWVDS